MIAAIDKVRVRGDSIGGVVTCIARNVPRVSVETLWLFLFCFSFDRIMSFKVDHPFQICFESDN